MERVAVGISENHSLYSIAGNQFFMCPENIRVGVKKRNPSEGRKNSHTSRTLVIARVFAYFRPPKKSEINVSTELTRDQLVCTVAVLPVQRGSRQNNEYTIQNRKNNKPHLLRVF